MLSTPAQLVACGSCFANVLAQEILMRMVKQCLRYYLVP